jgi:hypothetical protein
MALLFDDMKTMCKHYRPTVMHDTCEAGVSYKSVVQPPRPGEQQKKPCNGEIGGCAKYTPYTDADLEKMRGETIQFINAYVNMIADKKCMHCQSTDLEQNGRCVYCKNCGARLYQGRLPKGE